MFALYWGQEILAYKHWGQIVTGNEIDCWALSRNENYLEVKPLSSITDEDAIEVAKLVSSWEDDDRLLDPIDVPEWISEVLGGNCATYADYVSGYDASSLVDLLRSKGYALPAFGYSVDELVGAGVFKIKEVNND